MFGNNDQQPQGPTVGDGGGMPQDTTLPTPPSTVSPDPAPAAPADDSQTTTPPAPEVTTPEPASEPSSAPAYLTDDEPSSSDSDSSDDDSASPASSDGHDDLINIKQQALKELSPLVDHLDQTPEEKFRTTMMMIQAADDEKLVQAAYDAAQKITDEKARAQALLDIINEINYFTQQHNS